MVELSYPEIRVAVTKKPDKGNTYAMNFAGLSVDAVRVFSISVVLHAALETMLEEFAKNDKGEIQDNIEARQMGQSDLTKIVTDTDVEGNVVKTMKGRVITAKIHGEKTGRSTFGIISFPFTSIPNVIT
jgi:predicted RNA-binding protein Jag